MSFNKFKSDFFDEFPALATNKEISSFINNYASIKHEDTEPETAVDPAGARLSFGKYRGFLVSDLYKMDAGKQYLIWLYSQSFFDSDKFPELYKSITALGIKKKAAMNANARATKVPVGAR